MNWAPPPAWHDDQYLAQQIADRTGVTVIGEIANVDGTYLYRISFDIDGRVRQVSGQLWDVHTKRNALNDDMVFDGIAMRVVQALDSYSLAGWKV